MSSSSSPSSSSSSDSDSTCSPHRALSKKRATRKDKRGGKHAKKHKKHEKRRTKDSKEEAAVDLTEDVGHAEDGKGRPGGDAFMVDEEKADM